MFFCNKMKNLGHENKKECKCETKINKDPKVKDFFCLNLFFLCLIMCCPFIGKETYLLFLYCTRHSRIASCTYLICNATTENRLLSWYELECIYNHGENTEIYDTSHGTITDKRFRSKKKE